MAKKKTFAISNSLAQALGDTVIAAKNYSGKLNIDVVPLRKIELDPDNPRELVLNFTDLTNGILKDDPNYERKIREKESLSSMANSIKHQGILNPIIVYKVGDKYRLIAGERRTLAAILCNKDDIQARVLEGKPSQLTLSLLQWIENVEREDLSLWERLKNIEKIILAFSEEKKMGVNDLVANDISEIIGCSLQLAANYKSVLEAPSKLKMLIKNNQIRNLEKAALITRANQEKHDSLMEACLNGATLKELKRLAEMRNNFSVGKVLEKRGRQASCVNFGLTRNIKVAKTIIDYLLEHKQLSHLKTVFNTVNWDNFNEVSKVFKIIISTTEQQTK